MRITDIIILLCLPLASECFSFQPILSFQKSLKAKTTTALQAAGEEEGEVKDLLQTGIIPGVQQDDVIIDFGKCGVEFATETAVRIQGVIRRGKELNAECLSIEHFKAVQYIDGELPSDLTVLAEGVGIENYKDPGTSGKRETEYGPDEAAKAVLNNINKNQSAERLVINLLSGHDVNLQEVLDAVKKLATGLTNAGEIYFNSMSSKEFKEGVTSITCVSMKKLPEAYYDEDTVGNILGPSTGEIYANEGKYLTVAFEDAVFLDEEDKIYEGDDLSKEELANLAIAYFKQVKEEFPADEEKIKQALKEEVGDWIVKELEAV
mmetsp:Transcript_24359/g.36135  ORF Transcript_24359/g.36135 Transcript_24359/m.36135 type:complete len:321 (+) Transcript_24359:67-1029(+)|eukprot:CAMPEP_0194208732 /NCGR_PEP_ID=MMETSP0156-20130528/7100_1 /TAXON_ID=33649 /ORGANISM="Thalassionema nitzschioides, Strain L26-B" /LENGTH=320 /DNA_ID=CAMNT_0038935761 /DNA_START=67 /DNA_END=1029 /DNA_ORIENTATION=-